MSNTKKNLLCHCFFTFSLQKIIPEMILQLPQIPWRASSFKESLMSNTADAKVITLLASEEAEILRLNRRVLEESPDLIAIVGSDYIYYYVNPAYVRIHSMNEEDFIGHHVQEFLGEDVFERIVKPNLDQCVHGGDVRYEEWFDFGASGILYMDVRYLRLPNKNGAVDRIVIISRNITYMKESEEARVNQEKLKTVVELAGTYNHEINNPLCSIGGYLELLLAGETDPQKIHYLEKARSEAQRINQVTQKIEQTTSIHLADYPGGMKILKIHQDCEGTA
jgi:PAS domain S-box-containing protein